MSTRSHLGEDWRGQWERVLRAYSMVDHYRGVLPKDGPERDAALDEMWDFFQQGYALKYAVIKDGAKSKADVEAFINGDEAMRLCRDVADGTKHHRLDASYQPANPNWTTTEAVTTMMTPIGPNDQRNWFFTQVERGEWDMFELADECIRSWRRFLGL